MTDFPATIKIHCHACSETHEFDTKTGKCLSDNRAYPAWGEFCYTCTTGTAMTHGTIDKMHRLTDGTYADPEQWYKFTPELWGSYDVNTTGFHALVQRSQDED